MKPAVTGIILAGGKSKRMGENKALLKLGNDTLIGHVIRRIRPITDELLLITKNPDEYAHLGLAMHEDIVPHAGALGGIHAGLTYSSHETVLCVGCDTPFLVPDLLTHLITVLGQYDAVMPYTYADHENKKSTLQTLCAVYAKRCLPIVAQMLKESELRVHALPERANVLCLSPEIWNSFDSEGISFFNVNTPADFEKARYLFNSVSSRSRSG